MVEKRPESNWQFDSRPLKIGNRPDPGVCRWNVTHHWKYLKETYKFDSNLIPIKGLSWELWVLKVSGVRIETISRLLLGNPGTKSHSDVGPVGKRREYYLGKDVASFESGSWWVKWIMLPMACPNTKGDPEWRAPKSRGETHLRVSQSQVAEKWLSGTLPVSNSRKG
jgi:hypothetical protein